MLHVNYYFKKSKSDSPYRMTIEVWSIDLFAQFLLFTSDKSSNFRIQYTHYNLMVDQHVFFPMNSFRKRMKAQLFKIV